jgi:imidazolonepropionase-like amidohydrolase
MQLQQNKILSRPVGRGVPPSQSAARTPTQSDTIATMPSPKLLLLLLSLFATLTAPAPAQPPAQQPLVLEHGVYQVHLLLHAIGTEEYTITQQGTAGPRTLITTTSTNDRGMKRTSSTTLTFGEHFDPQHLEQKSGDTTNTTEIAATKVSVTEPSLGPELSRTFPRPATSFPLFTSNPAALQMLMMRYWQAHHQPTRLPSLRASPQALPVEIKLVGNEAFQINGRMVRLTRYTVANLIWGREILWMNDSFRVAAIMTFAGGLPQELILDEYASATSNIVRSGIRQQMLDLASLQSQVPPEAQGTYAITGARLIDGTGAAPIEHATVIIRDGRIASVSASAPPAGIKVIHAEGKSLLPGLWEMHSHYSGIEYGPALLAAGITTTRDCGGELEFLITIRDAIDAASGKHKALGPQILLAGLIDSGGPLAFGAVDVPAPVDAIHFVDFYADNHFQQIKVYTQLSDLLLQVIATEAHRRGLTVTGHVPAALTTQQGIADGMDQINHLQFITRALRPDPTKPLDLTTPAAKAFLALLHDKQIVVDPTAGWGEMAGHPRSIDPATFEPGLLAAPYTLASKFRALGQPIDPAVFASRVQTNLQVIKALYDAGVPIIAGSDTGLIGYGLDRELELYVQAGLPPIAAIQTATLNAARAMHLESDVGTIAPGKRADLILIDGNPLANISDIRRVAKVITAGRLYDSHNLARTVGFNR